MISKIFSLDKFTQIFLLIPLWIIIAFTIFFFDYDLIKFVDASYFYNFIVHNISHTAILMKSILLLLVLYESIWLSLVLQRHEIVHKSSFIASYIYCLLMLAFPQELIFSPIAFTNLFLIFFVDVILKIYSQKMVSNMTFIASMTISISALFFFPSLIFILSIWISLFLFSHVSLRNILASILGLFFTYLYLFSYYFFVDRIDEASAYYIGFMNLSYTFQIPNLDVNFLFYGLILVYVVYYMVKNILTSGEKLIRVRKKLQFLNLFLFISLFFSVFLVHNEISFHSFAFIPISIILASSSELRNWGKINEVLSLIFVGLIIASYFVHIL